MDIYIESTIYGGYLLDKTNLIQKYSYFGVILIYSFDAFMIKKKQRRERETTIEIPLHVLIVLP